MEDCKHPRVQNFKFADGAAAPLWGCADCAHKFVPINLPMEQDAERYRWLRDKATWAQATTLLNDTPGGIDAAVDAAMAAQKGKT